MVRAPVESGARLRREESAHQGPSGVAAHDVSKGFHTHTHLCRQRCANAQQRVGEEVMGVKVGAFIWVEVRRVGVERALPVAQRHQHARRGVGPARVP